MTPHEIPENKLAELEAILFLQGEPLSKRKISEMLGVSMDDLPPLLARFEEQLARSDRGLAFVSDNAAVQLVTKPEFHELVSRFVKAEFAEELSDASAETLSLIAYLGPVAKNRIEYLRGVNSSFILRSLLVRGLVERVPAPGRPDEYMYELSAATLRHLSLARREDLPDYEKLQSLLAAANEQTAP